LSFPLWAWIVLAILVMGLAAVDLLLINRRAHVVALREAAIWSAVWVTLGFAVAPLLAVWKGVDAGGQYLAGYILEYSLSVDNVFVFAVVFAWFGVPSASRIRVLLWGILGALVLRLVLILAGAALLDRFFWAIYVFGAFLVWTGIRLARQRGAVVRPERNPLLRLTRRLVPMTADYRGDRIFVREGGRRLATPMLAVLVALAATNVAFAADSIPAIFGVTREAFIVFAANAFALLGLRSLYFLLEGAMQRFSRLAVGLAAVLVLIGVKMLLTDVVDIPIWASLPAIVAVLALAVIASLRADRPGAGGAPEGALPPADRDVRAGA
jgi:tellurite resistance protein TerC